MKHVIRALALVLTVAMLSVTAFANVAGPAVPSVEQRPMPTIVPSVDAAGNPVIQIVDHTKENEVIKTAPYTDLLQVSLGDLDQADDTVKTELTKAFESIINAENLTKLNADLAKQAADMGVVTPAEELVVRDLFFLGLPEELDAELNKPENVMYLTFQSNLNAAANEQLLVMVMNEAGEWVLVNAEDIKFENGRYEVMFDFVGPVAFIAG